MSRYADARDQLHKNLDGSVESKVKAAEAMAVTFTPPPVASGQPLFFPDFPVRHHADPSAIHSRLLNTEAAATRLRSDGAHVAVI